MQRSSLTVAHSYRFFFPNSARGYARNPQAARDARFYLLARDYAFSALAYLFLSPPLTYCSLPCVSVRLRSLNEARHEATSVQKRYCRDS